MARIVLRVLWIKEFTPNEGAGMNWDNPLPSNQMYVVELNEHHGTTNERTEWKSIVGYEDGIHQGKFYELYLNYCKLMDSPLGRALS